MPSPQRAVNALSDIPDFSLPRATLRPASLYALSRSRLSTLPIPAAEQTEHTDEMCDVPDCICLIRAGTKSGYSRTVELINVNEFHIPIRMVEKYKMMNQNYECHLDLEYIASINIFPN